ncbi:MAG: competence/damage-inducible protein A [Opitutae bacterium]|nr:competence/damage-inducible protein A [Opitutae bacterium]
MSFEKRVEVIDLGDELLLGLRENSHLVFIGDKLAARGLEIDYAQVIKDDPEEIRRAFSESWERADLIITTGGLGPTVDDLTRETIAEALGLPLVFDEEILAHVQERFARRNMEMPENNKKQCFVPEGADILINRLGTAPGLFVEKEGKILAMLPGPPRELHPMLENELIPRLAERGILHDSESYVGFRTAGIGESSLEEKLATITNEIDGLHVSFCANQGLVDVRLSSEEHGELSFDRLKEIGHQCREMLGHDFVSFGHPSIARVVFRTVRSLEKTLAVAESCTGGLLSNAFTDIPGVSKVFAGSVISYQNDTKIQLLDVPDALIHQHGAVSAETAVAMATGAAERFSADYTLSVTGFAGPDGGTKNDPVGTIYIGYHSPVGVWSRKVVFQGERRSIQRRATIAALDWMRRKLFKYKAEEVVASGVDSGD